MVAAALRVPKEPVAKETENKKGSKAPKTPPKSPPVAKSPEPTVEEKSATPKSAFGGKRTHASGSAAQGGPAAQAKGRRSQWQRRPRAPASEPRAGAPPSPKQRPAIGWMPY
eukprot:gene31653-6850_t